MADCVYCAVTQMYQDVFKYNPSEVYLRYPSQVINRGPAWAAWSSCLWVSGFGRPHCVPLSRWLSMAPLMDLSSSSFHQSARIRGRQGFVTNDTWQLPENHVPRLKQRPTLSSDYWKLIYFPVFHSDKMVGKKCEKLQTWRRT